jgi:hypothetical protein
MRMLVTGVGGSASSNFIDSIQIANLGIDLIGVDSSANMISLSPLKNKFLVHSSHHPSYLSDINRLLRDFDCDLIHAQPDAEVKVISDNRELIDARFFLPSKEAIDLAADKQEFASSLRKANVPVPISGDGNNRAELIDVCDELLGILPKLWVRAKRGAGSRASLPVTTSAQAINWIEWWIQEKNLEWKDFQVSEFLPGDEYALQTLWQNGKLISAEARVRVSYLYGFLTPSGQSSTPSVARTTTMPEVYSSGISAIQALTESPHGVFCVDMKTDINSKIKVTEINAGRFFTTSNFFAHAGVNMPEMSVRAALGENLTPIKIGSLGDDLYWIRMVDMGFKLVHRDEIEGYARISNI